MGDLEISAKGKKVLVQIGTIQKMMKEKQGVQLPESIQGSNNSSGCLGVVRDQGNEVDIEIGEKEIVILGGNSGMKVFSFRIQDELRLIEQSEIYGSLDWGQDILDFSEKFKK